MLHKNIIGLTLIVILDDAKQKEEIESYNKSWGTMYRQTIHAAQIIMHWL